MGNPPHEEHALARVRNYKNPRRLCPLDHVNANQVGNATCHVNEQSPSRRLDLLRNFVVCFHRSSDPLALRPHPAAEMNDTPSDPMLHQFHSSRARGADIKRQRHQLTQSPRTANATRRFPHFSHNILPFLFMNRLCSPLRSHGYAGISESVMSGDHARPSKLRLQQKTGNDRIADKSSRSGSLPSLCVKSVFIQAWVSRACSPSISQSTDRVPNGWPSGHGLPRDRN